MPTTFLRTLVAASLVAAASTSCTPGDDAPPVDTEAQATVAPDWIHPACTAAALAPPIIPGATGATCNGPWTFGWQDQACTPAYCPRYNSAANWHRFVLGDWQAVGIKDDVTATGAPAWTVQAPVYTYEVRERCQFRTCTRIGFTGESPATKCPTIAGGVRNAIIADTVNLPTDLQNPALQIADPFQNHQEVLRRLQVNNRYDIIGWNQFTDEGIRYTDTTYQCWTQVVGRPVQTVGEWPVNQCAVPIVPATCTTATGTVTTAPGQQIPTSPGTSSLPGGTRTFTSGPTCQTCDDIPLASASAKLACYESSYATATAPLKPSLAARMKLLLQLAGELLAPAERARIYDLYATDASAPACSTDVTWSSACVGDAVGEPLARRAQLCNDLVANTQASAGAIDAVFGTCADLLAQTDQIPTATCRIAARDGIDADLQALMARREPTYGVDLSTTLPPVLTRLHQWSTGAHRAALGDVAWLTARTTKLVGRLWTAVHDARRPLIAPLTPGDPAAVTTARDLVTNVERDDLATDLAVLDLVFLPGRVTSPVALTLVGDALTAVANRAEHLQRFHDVGCKLIDCKPADVARDSTLAELTAVLAALPRQADLATALTSATKLATDAPALHATLGRIRDNHAYLTTAWVQAGRPLAEFAQLATLNNLPSEFAALGGLVRRAALADASYRAGGLFASTFQPRPTTAVLQVAALANDVQDKRNKLAQARDAYEAARVEQVNLALQAASTDGALEAIRQRGTQITNRKQVLIEQLASQSLRDQQERATIAGYQKAFEAVVDSGVLPATMAYDAIDLPPLEASAADAKFPPTSTVLNLARDAFTTFDLQTGETLRFEVGGQWSPSCRLRMQTIATPTGPTTISVPSNASGEFVTGPGGYWASYSAGTVTAQTITNTESWSTTYTNSVSACLSTANLPMPPGVIPLAEAEACSSMSTSHSTGRSEEDSSGRENKFAAAFNIGIRLPHTPMPTAPAGSLLAVMTPPGSPNQLLDVRVIDERTAVVIPKLPGGAAGTVRVHLVVNDSNGCALPANPSKLQIARTKVIPLGAVAGLLNGATATGLAAIEAAAVAVVAQGQLAPTEANRLRGLAWSEAQRVLQPQSVSLSQLPAELRSVFDNTVDAAIASVERRALMAATYNELDRLDDELAALRQEYAYAGVQRHLTSLLPRLRLRALDGDEMLSRSETLARILAVHVTQTLALRTLTWQPAEAGKIATAAVALIDLPLTSSLVTAVSKLESLALEIEGGLTDTQFDPSPPGPQLAVLAIPFPRAATDPLRYQGPYHTVSLAAAAQFWAEAQSTTNGRATIAPSPQDLYGGLATSSRLNCPTQGPMIRRMAVFLEHASTSDLNPLNINASTTAAASAPIDFPLVGRLFSLPSVAGGIPGQLRVIGDRAATEVQNKFTANVPPGLGAGAGLSPFTSFAIDMAFFRDPALVNFRNTTRALYLVFELEGRDRTGEVTVPGLCGTVPTLR